MNFEGLRSYQQRESQAPEEEADAILNRATQNPEYKLSPKDRETLRAAGYGIHIESIDRRSKKHKGNLPPWMQ